MEKVILIVEDEPAIRQLIKRYLESEPFKVLQAGNGAEAIRLLEEERPDLIILDILLPDINGKELARRIRKRSNLPLLFLSAKGEAEDIIEGLTLGGDDYMTKPFDPGILMARVKALLRRFSSSNLEIDQDSPLIRIDHLTINRNTLEVWKGKSLLPLYAKERQLLLYFLEHPNQVVSVNQIYEKIWGWESESDERTVMVHISNLRRKIEEDPAHPEIIRTVRGFGYIFRTAKPL